MSAPTSLFGLKGPVLCFYLLALADMSWPWLVGTAVDHFGAGQRIFDDYAFAIICFGRLGLWLAGAAVALRSLDQR